jgi:hypothetical protein
MTEERFVGYFRLVEACAERGCPVCWCLIAPTRAFGTLAGAMSVFGNDVHPRPRCPGP